MIYIYAIAYYCTDYILNSIHSLRDSTREEFNLTVFENQSSNSPLIRQLLEREVHNGNIDTYIAFSENLLSSAVKYAYKLNPPGADSEHFIVITDLDLKVPDNIDWVEELRRRFAYPEVGLVAFDLDLINYETPVSAQFRRLVSKLAVRLPYPFGPALRMVPDAWPRRGHNSGHLFSTESALDTRYQIYKGLYSGGWLLGMRKHIFDRFVETYDTCLDRHLNHFAQSLGFVIGRMPAKLYHYGWDAWKDYPEYNKYKLSILRQFHNEARELSSYEIITKVERTETTRK